MVADTAASGATPYIIHQTWKTTDIPKSLLPYAKSCRRANPNFTHKLWTDDDLRDLIVTTYPEYLRAYDSFDRNIERVDFARYAILHSIGGIYADLDMQCIRSFEPLVRRNAIILGNEPVEHRESLYRGRALVICNALMISPAGKPFWRSVMEFTIKHYKRGVDPVYNTGPMMLTHMYEKHPKLFNSVVVLSPCHFYAQSDNRTKKTQRGIPYISRECDIEANTPFAIHRWAHTWVEKDSKNTQMKTTLLVGGGVVLFVGVLLLVCSSVSK